MIDAINDELMLLGFTTELVSNGLSESTIRISSQRSHLKILVFLHKDERLEVWRFSNGSSWFNLTEPNSIERAFARIKELYDFDAPRSSND